MDRKLFYSWQSDLENRTNRGFIQDALEKAARAIRADPTLQVEPRIDQDTAGLPGSPSIAESIYQKIERSDIIVADVSIIGEVAGGRKMPNPNVLVEVGYALHALGDARILLVMNVHFGDVEDLPFDLKFKRVVKYCARPQGDDLPNVKKELASRLERHVRDILGHLDEIAPSDESSSFEVLLKSIQDKQPNAASLSRKFLEDKLERIRAVLRDVESEDASFEAMKSRLLTVSPELVEIASLMQAVAQVDSSDIVHEFQSWIVELLKRYEPMRVGSLFISHAEADLYKFLGHLLFTLMCAFLLREHRFKTIAGLLRESFFVRYPVHGDCVLEVGDVSRHVECVSAEANQRRVIPIAVRSELLRELIESGGMKSLISFDEFVAGDYFVFLSSVMRSESSEMERWDVYRPWSIAGLHEPPEFIRRAQSKTYAEKLAEGLGIGSVDEMKKLIEERAPAVGQSFHGVVFYEHPLKYFDTSKIGSR